MGTKRSLTAKIAECARELQDGPFLDLFAGTAAVAEAIQPDRTVWLNDVQTFSSAVNMFRFCGTLSRHTVSEGAQHVLERAAQLFKHRSRVFAEMLEEEQHALASMSYLEISGFYDALPVRTRHLRSRRDNLFSRVYAGSYFSFRQSIEIDCLRKALFAACRREKFEIEGVVLAALGRAMLQCSFSPGHFAQPLRRKPTSTKRLCQQWKQSIHGLVISNVGRALDDFSPRYRQSNRTFNSDALTLLSSLADCEIRPAVIYADPPYTSDQYSRYYHLFESVSLYDNPFITGNGRYRSGRFTSSFSLKREVSESIERIVSLSAQIGASLILSYPSNGLLRESHTEIPAWIKHHYRKPARVYELTHDHSTFGASKGVGRQKVVERLFVA